MSQDLTPDDVRRAAQQLRETITFHDPCLDLGHVLSPAAFQRGWGRCGNCFQLVGDIPKVNND